MPTKLKNLKIKRVALVDEGANPDAHIKFAKSKDGNEPMVDAGITSEEAVGLFERLAAVAKRVFMPGDAISKAAFTFAQTEEKRNYEKVMSDEVYPTIWAFTDSVCSILNDPEKSDDEKAALLKQSVSEFSESFSASSASWAKAEPASTGIVKDTDLLTKMRDSITALIEKKADDEDPPADGDSDDDDNDDDDDDDKDGNEPPVKKGVTDMEFDTSRMTPEEKAQFDDLAKRFSVSDPAPAGTPAVQPAANPQPEDGADVNKGLNLPPEVQAEIEALRKFRQDSEDRELGEIAKRYTIIGKKPEELLPVLKGLKAAGGDAFNQFVAGLDEAVKAVNDSGMFDEVGKRGTPSDSNGDAWSKIETAARKIQKAKPDTRWPDAVDAACNAHPELVQEYEKSRR